MTATREKKLVPPANQNKNSGQGLGAITEGFLKDYFDAHESVLPSPGLYDRVMNEVEKPLIVLTLQRVSGNQKKAAEVLGINRNTLRKKLLELNIDIKKI